MSPWVAGLVLFSAVLHASWNALLKGGSDRLHSITVMAWAAGLASAVCVPFLPVPYAESWVYILLSVALHVAYNLLLVASYRHGDLGVIYPVARGSSPMLVAAGAAVVAGERLDIITLAGIALVCGGIFGLAREARGGKLSQVIVPAVLTGVTIAGYTVIDGLGSRASGNSWAYAAWLFILNGLSMIPVWAWRWTAETRIRLDTPTLRSAAGGTVSLVAYAIVISAATISPMGPVSALRESSVVVAAVLGWLFLGERLGWRRLVACLVVAVGAACLGLR
ncbi:DMT family transporter [Limnoglobus roseus]|uniref:EamA family transporter n=1 Tax=Limnoglobus roseus TaxID=2598579 RepID=A0A5C1ADA3_9BACT|nr:DMT family transporter [Limnoglobus roseus]QEL15084.1 EamA family transporter [Limnoglobus roseus]